MAKRSDRFGDSASPQDKKKITKEGLRKALSIFRFTAPYKGTFAIGFIFLILSVISGFSILVLFIYYTTIFIIIINILNQFFIK